ncbi:hypothetical protein [Streptomyces sp. NPDC001970]
MHRADDQDTLDLIRAFMSMHVTLVLIGVDIPASGLLREGRLDPATGQSVLPASRHATAHGLEATQSERRFDLVELDRFRYDTDERSPPGSPISPDSKRAVRLLNARPGMLTEGRMPEYLFARTNGVVGLLERLIEDGCTEAITNQTECLTQTLVDSLPLTLAGAPGRDAQAGEIPALPTDPAPQPPVRRSGRHRNGAFDDPGPAAGTA